MRPQTMIVVILALAFGGVAGGGVFLISKPTRNEAAQKSKIVVIAADVPRGMPLTAEHLATRETSDQLTPGVLTKPEDAIGRSALVSLFKDEPLMEAKLAPKGAARGLASLLKQGMRAVTIPTPSVGTNVAGFLEVGSHVDILWTPQEFKIDDSVVGTAAPLLENVEVLAVDDKIDTASGGKGDGSVIKSVTVQLKPEDAAKLAPALTRGAINLSLRNPSDEGRAQRLAVIPAPIKPREAIALPTVVAAQPAPPVAIRTIRGSREGWVRISMPAAAK